MLTDVSIVVTNFHNKVLIGDGGFAFLIGMKMLSIYNRH